MKQFKVITLIFVMAIIGNTKTSAQDLTGEIISNSLRQKAQILNDYISLIAQKDKSMGIKKHYIDKALSLFVNKDIFGSDCF